MLNAYFILKVSKNMKVLCYSLWCVIQNLFSLSHKNVLWCPCDSWATLIYPPCCVCGCVTAACSHYPVPSDDVGWYLGRSLHPVLICILLPDPPLPPYSGSGASHAGLSRGAETQLQDTGDTGSYSHTQSSAVFRACSREVHLCAVFWEHC